MYYAIFDSNMRNGCQIWWQDVNTVLRDIEKLKKESYQHQILKQFHCTLTIFAMSQKYFQELSICIWSIKRRLVPSLYELLFLKKTWSSHHICNTWGTKKTHQYLEQSREYRPRMIIKSSCSTHFPKNLLNWKHLKPTLTSHSKVSEIFW